jgi:hypothetical protein
LRQRPDRRYELQRFGIAGVLIEGAHRGAHDGYFESGKTGCGSG